MKQQKYQVYFFCFFYYLFFLSGITSRSELCCVRDYVTFLNFLLLSGITSWPELHPVRNYITSGITLCLEIHHVSHTHAHTHSVQWQCTAGPPSVSSQTSEVMLWCWDDGYGYGIFAGSPALFAWQKSCNHHFTKIKMVTPGVNSPKH